MKKRISALLTAASAALWTMAGPQCVWLQPEHDFGAFNEDLGSVECVFKGVNTGDEPLVVMAARANCGCTVPEYDRKPVMPDDTLHIKVKFNANGRPGRFDKKVYLYTNTEKDKYVLTIKGTVIGSQNTVKSRYPVEAGPMRINSSLLPMGEIFKGHIASAYIRAYNISDQPISPSLTDLPPYMSYEVRPKTVRPGEQFIISLNSYSDKCPQWGLVTDTLTLIPDKENQLRIPVTTVVTVKEDFSKLSGSDRAKAPKAVAETDVIDFGRFNRSDKPLQRTIMIKNEGGGNPLLIRRVFTPAKGVDIAIKNSKKGIKRNADLPLTVTVDPHLVPELLNARITLITNDPDNPVQIIRVIGEPVQ